ESAMNDLSTRNLLSKQSFLNPLTNPFTQAFTPDPWLYDTPGPGQTALANGVPQGAYARWGAGLPVAYDPLWRASARTGRYAGPTQTYGGFGYYLNMAPSEARFGSGLGFIRQDTSSNASSPPSAHGLQRLTNFNPNFPSPAAPANNLPVVYPPNT